jgi:ElaB/YqjD/DUF883 family membrane-anchored ribosome-binding protein
MCTVEQCATYQSARSVALQKEFSADTAANSASPPRILGKDGRNGQEKCHAKSSHRASDAEKDPAVKATTAAKSDVEMPPDVDAIVDDIAALKRDLATLMNHMKTDAINGASETAQSAIGRIGDRAENIYESLVAQGKRSGKAIGRQVEEQPVVSLLLAFAVGFCVSRLLSR